MGIMSLVMACDGGAMSSDNITYQRLEDVPAAKWEKLARKKIYFGHQSVGYNILDGIAAIMAQYPKIKLNIVETADASDFRVGVLAHSTVGKNVDPTSKINDFSNYINQGIGKKADFAALKFCYVDIAPETDVDKMLGEYTQSVEALKRKYAGVKFIHFTSPLTINQTGYKAWIKKLLGRSPYGMQENVKRHEYNQLLLQKYLDKEPVFDIATIESTFPDGSRATFQYDGKSYYSLVPEYTSDGGHLNELGQKKVASQFLVFLANLV